MSKLRMNVVSLEKFTHEYRIKYLELCSGAEEIVNSPNFKMEVLNHQYRSYYGSRYFGRWGKFKDGFIDSKDNNLQVYNKFMEGESGLWNVMVEAYYSSKNVIGYTYPSTQKVWVNIKYINQPKVLLGNLIHEQCHNLGYGHSRSWSRSRKYSVPYGLGYIAGKLY